jgi:uncharacterized protein (TIGR03086 family)
MGSTDQESIADRYRRLSAAFEDLIEAVPAQAWSNPAPCEGWTAADVAAHVVETQAHFLTFIGEEAGEIPDPREDPGGAWKAARSAVQLRLDDPEIAGREFQGFQGPTRWEDAVDRFLNFDLTVHPWDLAKAASLDHRMELADIERCRAVSEGLGEMMRSSGAFGPELEPPAGAGPQEQFLAHLGRQA